MSNKNNLTIGLFGFGVVGEGIYKVLHQTPSLHTQIKKICIKNSDKKRDAPTTLFTTVANDILQDDEINVIVELIDDSVAAFEIVSTALKNKKHVVSANKKMIAEHFDELLKLQAENEMSFLYEASVCGSIPVIRNLEEYYDNDLLDSVSGIVNGSTNFILTKMSDEGLAYADALKLAQQLGFAESNPALDVEGNDAVNKLTIIIKHAYGITRHPSKMLHKGITHLHANDTKYAQEKLFSIKLVANAIHIGDGKIAAYLLPAFVPANNYLHFVNNEYNGVIVGTKLADKQFLFGKGAGRYPTASAVLSDISALRFDYQYEYRKSNSSIKYALTDDFILPIYVSYNKESDIKKNDFIAINETYTSTERSYLIGTINASTLQNAEWFNNKDVSVIVTGLPQAV